MSCARCLHIMQLAHVLCVYNDYNDGMKYTPPNNTHCICKEYAFKEYIRYLNMGDMARANIAALVISKTASLLQPKAIQIKA